MTVNDPWAETTTNKKDSVVADRIENSDISITLKGDGAAPWIVFHKDQADAEASVGRAVESGLLKTVAEAAAKFAAEWAAARGQATPPAPRQAQQSAPPVQQSAPPVGGGAKQCDHGDRVYKSGEKNGKKWGAWFCSAEKGDPNQCKPQWEKF